MDSGESHFDYPENTPPGSHDQLRERCQRCGLSEMDLLHKYFQQFIQPQEIADTVLEPFIAIYHGFLPGINNDSAKGYKNRVKNWPETIKPCTDESRRRDYLRYYIEHHVPDPLWQPMARKYPEFHPAVQQLLQEQTQKLLKQQALANTGNPPAAAVSASPTQMELRVDEGKQNEDPKKQGIDWRVEHSRGWESAPP